MSKVRDSNPKHAPSVFNRPRKGAKGGTVTGGRGTTPDGDGTTPPETPQSPLRRRNHLLEKK